MWLYTRASAMFWKPGHWRACDAEVGPRKGVRKLEFPSGHFQANGHIDDPG